MTGQPGAGDEGPLRALILLDFEAIRAYQAAIGRSADEGLRAGLARQMADHEEHARRLAAYLAAAGGRPPTGREVRGRLAARVTGAAGTLVGLLAAEEEAAAACEAALGQIGPQTEAARTLGDALSHLLAGERRHRRWLARQLGRRSR